MQEIPAESIDLILCDLPYGTTQNPWDTVIDFTHLWQQYERIIKVNGVIALTGHGLFTARLIMSKPEWFRYKVVWIKSKAPNFLQANRQPLKKHEDICIFFKKQPVYHPQMTAGTPYDRGRRKNSLTGCYGNYHPVYVQNTGNRYPADLLFFEPDDWIYCKTAEAEGKTFHPAQKPVELGRYLIRTYTNPGDVVLDNACGSGSFLVAAIREQRQFMGIEKNKGAFEFKTTAADFIKSCSQRIQDELLTTTYQY
jgi:site-specific DNA-methyltransferase (adenine-specific)